MAKYTLTTHCTFILQYTILIVILISKKILTFIFQKEKNSKWGLWANLCVYIAVVKVQAFTPNMAVSYGAPYLFVRVTDLLHRPLLEAWRYRFGGFMGGHGDMTVQCNHPQLPVSWSKIHGWRLLMTSGVAWYRSAFGQVSIRPTSCQVSVWPGRRPVLFGVQVGTAVYGEKNIVAQNYQEKNSFVQNFHQKIVRQLFSWKKIHNDNLSLKKISYL